MSLLIISDLHIKGPEDHIYRALLSLLRERAASGDTVILAGDLFDLFVGNKEIFKTRYQEFFAAVKDAGQKGVRVHYIEGNHDFLIGKVFDNISGVEIHPKEVSLEISGKKFYVVHGDTVDRGDYAYRFLRFFFRSPVMKLLVTLVPGTWLDKIGQNSSQQSRKRKPMLFSELPMQRMENLRRIYRSFAAERLAQGYDYVVMGHCHDLDEMCFNIGGRMGQYMNVGFPKVHKSYLTWTPGDEKIHRERLPQV